MGDLLRYKHHKNQNPQQTESEKRRRQRNRIVNTIRSKPDTRQEHLDAMDAEDDARVYDKGTLKNQDRDAEEKFNKMSQKTKNVVSGVADWLQQADQPTYTRTSTKGSRFMRERLRDGDDLDLYGINAEAIEQAKWLDYNEETPHKDAMAAYRKSIDTIRDDLTILLNKGGNSDKEYKAWGKYYTKFADSIAMWMTKTNEDRKRLTKETAERKINVIWTMLTRFHNTFCKHFEVIRTQLEVIKRFYIRNHSKLDQRDKQKIKILQGVLLDFNKEMLRDKQTIFSSAMTFMLRILLKPYSKDVQKLNEGINTIKEKFPNISRPFQPFFDLILDPQYDAKYPPEYAHEVLTDIVSEQKQEVEANQLQEYRI